MTQGTQPPQNSDGSSISQNTAGDTQVKRAKFKQALLEQLENHHRQDQTVPHAPITNLDLNTKELGTLTAAIMALESVNPYPAPLQKGIHLLNAIWLLRYSDAREITTLSTRIRLGFQLEKVYQTINVDSLSFENRAFVKHQWSLVAGAVSITARFEPALQPSELQNRRINVYFEERSLCIRKLLGMSTPFLDPFKVIPATPPLDRIPSLDITYLDQDLRIGRGGDGSLFVLTKEQAS